MPRPTAPRRGAAEVRALRDLILPDLPWQQPGKAGGSLYGPPPPREGMRAGKPRNRGPGLPDPGPRGRADSPCSPCSSSSDDEPHRAGRASQRASLSLLSSAPTARHSMRSDADTTSALAWALAGASDAGEPGVDDADGSFLVPDVTASPPAGARRPLEDLPRGYSIEPPPCDAYASQSGSRADSSKYCTSWTHSSCLSTGSSEALLVDDDGRIEEISEAFDDIQASLRELRRTGNRPQKLCSSANSDCHSVVSRRSGAVSSVSGHSQSSSATDRSGASTVVSMPRPSRPSAVAEWRRLLPEFAAHAEGDKDAIELALVPAAAVVLEPGHPLEGTVESGGVQASFAFAQGWGPETGRRGAAAATPRAIQALHRRIQGTGVAAAAAPASLPVNEEECPLALAVEERLMLTRGESARAYTPMREADGAAHAPGESRLTSIPVNLMPRSRPQLPQSPGHGTDQLRATTANDADAPAAPGGGGGSGAQARRWGDTNGAPSPRGSTLQTQTPEGGSGQGRGLMAWMSSTLCCFRYSRARRRWEPTPGCSHYLRTLRQLDPVIVACILAGALMGAYMVAWTAETYTGRVSERQEGPGMYGQLSLWYFCLKDASGRASC